MDIITQTNRTVLFAEINPEKLDLITLVGDVRGIVSLNDEKIKEIDHLLTVRSFEEFLEKFSPCIYSVYNASEQKVIYTLERPENIPDDSITVTRLDRNNEFLGMLLTLMDAKRAQGAINTYFYYETMLDTLSPRKVMENIKRVRKEIHCLYNKYIALDDEDPRKQDLGVQLDCLFEEASRSYNDIPALLPLAMEDIKTRILFGRTKGFSKDKNPGLLAIGDTGELMVATGPCYESNALVISDAETNTALASVFEDDYYSISQNPSSYIKDLIIRTFCPFPDIQSEIDIEKEVGNYNAYLQFYKNAKEDFVKTAKALIEKILGVKMFFDQYKTKNKGMLPALLITNIKPESIAKSNILSRVEAYLSSVNTKNDFTNTLWFGIVPGIEWERPKTEKPFVQIFGTAKELEEEGKTSIKAFAALLEILAKYRIQVFFNFLADERTTFNSFAISGIDKYIDKCKTLANQHYSQFAIPCIPNFTIIPRDKSFVVLERMTMSQCGEIVLPQVSFEPVKLWLGGIYIDASYAAAGIAASYQCPQYLKGFFGNVSMNYPGVRFDIESGDNNLKVTTTIPREISGFTQSLKDSINKHNFGFVFSSDHGQIEDKYIRNITVYKARSLAYRDTGFAPIFQTLVRTYIERILKFSTNDFREDKIKQFFSNNPASQKNKWMEDRGFANSILQEGDNLNFSIEDGIFEIKLSFNGNSRSLD